MKVSFFFVLFCTLLALGCKKKNPDPDIPKANHALTHSGMVDTAGFSLDTTAVTPQLVKMSQWDAVPYKVFTIETWLKGPHLDVPVPIPAGQERLSLQFSLLLQYAVSDYDSDCNCLPTPTAARLANHINNGSYGWNDGTERKEILVMVMNSQFGGGSFNSSNAQISAQAIGNSLRIYGTVDSLKVGWPFGQARFLTDLDFDYTIPVSL